MNKGFLRLLGFSCIACSLLFVQSATAAERGFYVGILYGQGEKDSDREPFANLAAAIYDFFVFTPEQSTSSFDTKDSVYGFFGGYRAFNHLAFEGGYMDLGKVVYRDESVGVDDDIGPSTWNQKLSSHSKGLMLSALGILPLGYRGEVFVRGGAIFTTNSLDTYISNGLADASNPTPNRSDTDLLAGVGAGFTFAEIYTIRVEYQRIFDAGHYNTSEADLDMLNLSVAVTF